MIRIRFYGRGGGPLSARFELPWHSGEHSHLVFVALLMQVGAGMRALARAPVTKDSTRRAAQQEMAVREGRAHDECDPNQRIDEAGASIVPHRQDDAHAAHERQDDPGADRAPGA